MLCDFQSSSEETHFFQSGAKLLCKTNQWRLWNYIGRCEAIAGLISWPDLSREAPPLPSVASCLRAAITQLLFGVCAMVCTCVCTVWECVAFVVWWTGCSRHRVVYSPTYNFLLTPRRRRTVVFNSACIIGPQLDSFTDMFFGFHNDMHFLLCNCRCET